MQNLYSCILQTPSQHGGSAEPDAGLCPEQGVLPRWKKLTDTNHKAGTPPCLHKPCHTRALHRADQAGIWRKEAQPKQGWLQYIRGSVREVRTCSYHMHMAVSKEEGRGQCWARRC